MKPATVREGGKWLPEKQLDVFFVTLNKADKDYSPKMCIRDREQVLVVVFGLAERICVGGKIGDCVDKAPTVFADPFQIRCVIIASLQFFLQAQVVLPLAIGRCV